MGALNIPDNYKWTVMRVSPDHFGVIVVCEVDNQRFDSQTHFQYNGPGCIESAVEECGRNVQDLVANYKESRKLMYASVSAKEAIRESWDKIKSLTHQERERLLKTFLHGTKEGFEEVCDDLCISHITEPLYYTALGIKTEREEPDEV